MLYSGQPSVARDEPEEWVAEKLTYGFTVKRLSLVAILNTGSVPLGTARVLLSEAGEVIGCRYNVSRRIGLEAIVEAAAAGRIEVYGNIPVRLRQVR